MRVLVLGGTTEASSLARLMAGDSRFEATLSLAGRTANPQAQPLPTRIGGFGGAEGLAEWLIAHGIEAVVDATHPYAAIISRNAVAACGKACVPLASLIRPPWGREAADRWSEVPDAKAAAAMLGETPRRVFLSLGRLELAAFAAAPRHHYVARSIDPPGHIALPPDIRFIYARGPFDETSERELIAAEGIDLIVSKNSGGSATYAKIAVARALAIPVIMIARPQKPTGTPVSDAKSAIGWLEGVRAHPAPPGSRRSV